MAGTSEGAIPRSYDQFCPLARTLDLVGERWTLLIVRDLADGPLRFGELSDRVGGVSRRVLAERLRRLQTLGLVEATPMEGSTRRTYALTPRGSELTRTLAELARWGLPLLDLPTVEEPLVASRVPNGVMSMVRTECLPPSAFAVGLDLDVTVGVLRVASPEGPHGGALHVRDRVTYLEALGADPLEGEAMSIIEAGSRAAAASSLPVVDVTVRGDLAGLLWVRRGDLTWAEAETDGVLRLIGRPRQRSIVEAMFSPES